MQYTNVGALRLPAVAVGCMGLNKLDAKGAENFLSAALGEGLNFFDHADIYGRGECESVFGAAFAALGVVRDKVYLQSKCGIIPGKMYDFSEKHILEAVDGSLARLRTDYLDILLLHRPDALMEPEEVASAFSKLKKSGKVRSFGVSNMHPYQIELLKSCMDEPIVADQLQFSPAHAGMVACGFEVNMLTDGAIGRDGYILEYCRLHGIAVQAWSPFRFGFFDGVFLGNEKYAELNAVLGRLAEKYGVEPAGIVTAWILRHPAKTQVVTGTTSVKHLLEAAQGAKITLTREEWYEIYKSAGHILP